MGYAFGPVIDGDLTAPNFAVQELAEIVRELHRESDESDPQEGLFHTLTQPLTERNLAGARANGLSPA